MERHYLKREIDHCELAWAAGLFEGEGCFGITHSLDRRYVYLRAGLQMTDRDVVERFKEIFGLKNKITTPNRQGPRHKKQLHVLTVTGRPAMELAESLRPWLGHRRTARLNEILDAVKRNPPKRLHARLSQETKDAIMERYAGGSVTITQLAREFGVHYESARNAAHGVRGRHRPKGRAAAGSARALSQARS